MRTIKMKKLYIQIIWIFLLYSCTYNSQSKIYEYEASSEISERAFAFAELYKDAETEYFFGGQDPLRSVIKMDCSGLVIMSYKYALVDTGLRLIQNDMTANYMAQNASNSVSLSQMRKGDLLFMGDADSQKITHIALFEYSDEEYIYFIDCTQKDINNDGVDDINGVSKRAYLKNDKRFKKFGRMKVIK